MFGKNAMMVIGQKAHYDVMYGKKKAYYDNIDVETASLRRHIRSKRLIMTSYRVKRLIITL